MIAKSKNYQSIDIPFF